MSSSWVVMGFGDEESFFCWEGTYRPSPIELLLSSSSTSVGFLRGFYPLLNDAPALGLKSKLSGWRYLRFRPDD